MRVAIFGVGACATIMALTVTSIYSLFVLCSDMVFVILFPQLCCVIYFKHSNTYGCIFGYVLGVILRVGGGESKIGLRPFIKYPFYDEDYGQLFPFRTLCMVCSFTSIVVVSFGTKALFEKEILPPSMDFLHCFTEVYTVQGEKKEDYPLEKREGSGEPAKC